MMNNKGFTLIELIVTIALLSIIAMISFVSVNAVIKSNKIEQCNNLISSIETATKEYVSDNRYKNLDVDNFNASKLNGYLSMPIVNPITNEDINASNIQISIILNDDNTVKNIQIDGLSCE